MSIPNFPSNSDSSKRQPEEKDLQQVTSGEVKRRKKPLSSRFSEVLLAGTPRDATQYVMFEVLLPAAKENIAEGIESWFRQLMFGNTARRGASTPASGATGHINYGGRFAMGAKQAARAMSTQARTTHDFDEIILDSRAEAENVIDQLYEVVSSHGSVSVADLYALVGIAGTHVDRTWGWEDLRGAGVSRVRGGYLLDLPRPQPLR